MNVGQVKKQMSTFFIGGKMVNNMIAFKEKVLM